MKLLISVDIEGVGGVVSRQQVLPGNEEYERARHYMIDEANAAIAGAFDAGASEVIVNDSHAGFRNLIPSEMDSRAYLISGRPRILGMMSGLEFGVDAVALVGYHSRAGGRGVLAHTTNGSAFAALRINGVELSECAEYSALAAERGVPTIFASGDDCLRQENQMLLSDTCWVETKTAMGAWSALSKHPNVCCQEIRKQMGLAVGKFLSGERFAMIEFQPKPFSCEIVATYPYLADQFSILPFVKRIDGRTIGFLANSIEYAVRIFNTCSALATSLMN